MWFVQFSYLHPSVRTKVKEHVEAPIQRVLIITLLFFNKIVMEALMKLYSVEDPGTVEMKKESF